MLINDITRFMYEHCTGVGAEKAMNQGRFIASIDQILSATELKPRTIEELWSLSWDKPIWSWGSAKTASEVRGLTIKNSLFQDFHNFSEDEELNLRSLKGLRLVKDTLLRIEGLHKNFQSIYHSYEEASLRLLNPESQYGGITSKSKNIDVVRKLIGVPPYNIPNSLFDKFGNLHGYKTKASATRLHTLTDYGFPVCKTDIWIVRLTQAIAMTTFGDEGKSIEAFFKSKLPNFNLELGRWNGKFLEKNPEFSFWIIDFLLENHFDFDDPFWETHKLDVKSHFNAHRLVDLILAKFGMKLEVGFGLVESPMDILDPNNSKCNTVLTSKYSQLSLLAEKASQLRSQDGSGELPSPKLQRIYKPSRAKSDDVIPIEVDVYRNKLTKFQQYLFDSKIKMLRAKRVSWGDILIRMLKIPADKFEDTKF